MSNKREDQLTEMAKRQGLVLIKSRAKRQTAEDHQQYRIVDQSNYVMAGEKFDLSLEDVEKFLHERASSLAR